MCRSIPRPKTPPSGLVTPGLSSSSKTPNYVDFISQTDDDWDVDLGDDAGDNVLGSKKVQPPRSIEYKPPASSKLNSGAGGSRSQTPVYPTPRRRDTNGLKPQFEGLVRGEGSLLENIIASITNLQSKA